MAADPVCVEALRAAPLFTGLSEADLERLASTVERQRLVAGASEEDLVNSGLEETMVAAWHEIRTTRERLGASIDARISAFVTAIDKIVASYANLGIWP